MRKSLRWALVGNNKADINRAGERKNEQRTLVVRGVCWLLVGWSMWRRLILLQVLRNALQRIATAAIVGTFRRLTAERGA